MVTRTFTATVDDDGRIRIPDGTARPGTVVTVVVQHNPTTDASPASNLVSRDEPLTVVTADTPEKRARFVEEIRRWGDRTRSSLPDQPTRTNFDDWMYEEDGPPR